MLLVLLINRFFQLGAAGLNLIVEISHDGLINQVRVRAREREQTSLTHSSLKVSLLRSLSGLPAMSCIPENPFIQPKLQLANL